MLHTGRAWGSLPIQPRLNQHNPSSIIQAKAALLIGVGFVVVYDQRVLRERCSMIRTSPTLSIALSLYPSIPLSLYLSLSIYLSLSLYLSCTASTPARHRSPMCPRREAWPSRAWPAGAWRFLKGTAEDSLVCRS